MNTAEFQSVDSDARVSVKLLKHAEQFGEDLVVWWPLDLQQPVAVIYEA